MQLKTGNIAQRLRDFIHNPQTWGFIISVAIMAIISIAFFYPDNIEGNSLRQGDMVQGIANGHEVVEWRDATGETPRWTNSLFSGMPTFQISPSYSSDGLFSWINKIFGLGLPSPSNLLFMMMLGFMILMMAMGVRWYYGLIGAIAWGFSTYFIIIIGAGHIWKFITLAYIPPTIGGVILAYRGRYLAGGALAALFAMMQIGSNHVQMTYYFGFVILALAIGYLIKSAKERELRRWGIASATLVVAAGLALCANLPNLYHTSKYAAETQREQSELSATSAEEADAQMREFITHYSYQRSETFSLFIPNIKGGASAKPVEGQMIPVSLSETDAAADYAADPYVSTYLQFSSQYFGDPEGTNGPVYVGAIIFALFIIGCIVVKGPVKWGLLAVLIITVILSWGRHAQGFTDLFIDLMPMYSKFRTVESILVVAQFIIPLLAVMGLWKLFSGKVERKHCVTATIIGFGLPLFFALIAALLPGIFGEGVDMAAEQRTSQMLGEWVMSQGGTENDAYMLSINNPAIFQAVEDAHFSLVRADAWRTILFLLLGAGAIAAYLKNSDKKGSSDKNNNRMRNLSVAAIGVLVLVDLYSVNKRYINHESFVPMQGTVAETVIQPTKADKEILAADTTMNYRVFDVDRFSSAEPSYFHKTIGGYHAAKLGRYNDLLTTGLISQDNVLNMLNAKYFVQGEYWVENPDALGNAWFVDRVEYVDGASAEFEALAQCPTEMTAVADSSMREILGDAIPTSDADIIYETTYAPDKLTYIAESEAGGVAVFSEIYFPWGWNATIDGQPAEIARVNYVLRAMRIPAGRHTIEMQFDPASVHTTTTVATIAIILIYLAVVATVAMWLIGGKEKSSPVTTKQ